MAYSFNPSGPLQVWLLERVHYKTVSSYMEFIYTLILDIDLAK